MKSSDDLVILMGDFNAEPSSLTYKEIIESGFRSSYSVVNGKEPSITFPTGLQAPFMDRDPPLTVDFIFYRVGKDIQTDPSKHIRPTNSKRMAEKHHPGDPTIHGSDHFPIITDFEIHPL